MARPEKLPQPLQSQGAQRFIEFGEHLAGMIAWPVGRQQLVAQVRTGLMCFKKLPVTRRFKRLAALAGLPVIKLHEGRHPAASLARDAEVDPEIRRRTLGYADAAMTAHYTHTEAEAHKAAAEAVARLVEGAAS